MFEVHLLDVGTQKYGECVLVRIDGHTILIDGGHKGDEELLLPQLTALLGAGPSVAVDVIHISHAHADHTGCLPGLIGSGDLTARVAFIPDVDLAWPDSGIVLDGVADAPTRDAFALAWAMLREQPVELDRLTDAQVGELMADAINDETRYRQMTETLEAAGTRVLTWPSDDAEAELNALLTPAKLSILGPGAPQVRACAGFLQRSLSDAVNTGGSVDPVALLRQLEHMDAGSRPGKFVNLQSIVVVLESASGRRALFAGDCQFVEPGTRDPEITNGLDEMRRSIAASAPYGFAKLSHHGSANSVDGEWLDLLGDTPLVGMCSGSGHAAHPPAETIELLAKRGTVDWVRTDRNGRVGIDLETGTPTHLAHEPLNNAVVNSSDTDLSRPLSPPISPPTSTPVVQRSAAADDITVTAIVPARKMTVRLTIEVDEDGAAHATPTVRTTIADDRSPAPEPAPERGAGPSPAVDFPLAARRALPNLLFVSNVSRLRDAIGHQEAGLALDMIRAGGQRLLLVPDDAAPRAIADRIKEEIGDARGVVLVGGYKIVPSFRVDTLPSDMPDQQQLRAFDMDRFIVWSDDPYVDLDGDGFPELPISRIPDARDRFLLLQALAADSQPPERAGLRNAARPFADAVYAALPGSSVLAQSFPIAVDTFEPAMVSGTLNYLMLHGSDIDATRYWGESDGRLLEAFRVSDLPDEVSGIFFSGCCWGALTVSSTASAWKPGAELAARVVEQSIALSLLARGASTFVGCTGAHYSPRGDLPDSFGGPMHTAFYRHLVEHGQPPAQALLEAKRDYLQYLFGVAKGVELAVATKILNQFTCLGLGW